MSLLHGEIASCSVSLSLLRRARNSEPDAWERLFRLFHPFVYRWLRMWRVPEADAPDVSQNVFAKVYAAIGALDRESPGTSFRGWLWRIARNEAVSFFRTRRLLPMDDARLANLPEAQDPDESRQEDVELLHRALELIRDDFHPRTFEAFWMGAFQGCNSSEIGAHLGMNATAVREAKRRVFARLREEYLELIGRR